MSDDIRERLENLEWYRAPGAKAAGQPNRTA